ncbi:MAG: ACT domain-containing protein [Alphaproteobacteria bacterium]|uniref:ACT domain-containing protein n=1 Tax=Maricaulis alexandrii TaxID=2570354 RepID=UPI001109ABAE|nr:ACT domain-containing protein [Maricaulis alexandrii]MCR9268205.1 ACT domain-containing protein [Alphaproteobacteria bacterium]
MSGNTDQTAGALLARMAPVLDPQDWVYARLPEGTPLPPDVSALMTCQEDEGLTLIVTPDTAARLGLATDFPCRRITLTVQSDLDAVGFIAAIATELTRHGISCNVVAGFHHDHLLVPQDRAGEAMDVLKALSRSNSIDAAPDRP